MCDHVSVQDLLFIMNDAKDDILLADAVFMPQLSRLLPSVASCKAVVLLTDRWRSLLLLNVKPGSRSCRSLL